MATRNVITGRLLTFPGSTSHDREAEMNDVFDVTAVIDEAIDELAGASVKNWAVIGLMAGLVGLIVGIWALRHSVLRNPGPGPVVTTAGGRLVVADPAVAVPLTDG